MTRNRDVSLNNWFSKFVATFMVIIITTGLWPQPTGHGGRRRGQKQRVGIEASGDLGSGHGRVERGGKIRE